MADYKAPIRDIEFTLFELLGYAEHCQQLPNGEDTAPDVISAILEESAKFCENVIAPLNSVGDTEGCQWVDGEVTTPSGFKEAYQQYVDAGWPTMSHSVEYGGQGLPDSLGHVLSELNGSANWSWSMYPGLSHGAMKTIESHGTEEQKSIYLTKLVEGAWTGTMCLTESHCGSDLGMLRSKAIPNDDGSYSITGTKIFISSGEHDLAENIVHIVLARLPDAPEGTKGISLFIVPKFLPDQAGNVGDRNAVKCGSLEHKMGIHGNATCVLNFDGAKGFLIGPPNRGLNCMFTFMNIARIGTAIQGLSHAEVGYQKSLAYAKDRLQMRSLSGAKNPDGPADPIIVHPDVRRMLLTQRAFAEGGRMLIYYAAILVDVEKHGQEDKQQEANQLLALLTPIAKAFLTEVGFESSNLGMQCFGGHGYIREWGMEQNVRDARIAMLYEGTTGIQALDLLGRKVLMSQGENLKVFTKQVHLFCKANQENENVKHLIEPLANANKAWGDLTMHVGLSALENQEEVGGAAVDYLMFSGYVCLAYFWARAAVLASQKLEVEASDFYAGKLKTANFYFARILPRAYAHDAVIRSGVSSLLDMTEDQF
ncbi:acyl-CoA dehydrogenase C-terminal domain-containing protein [Teredinibacter sp. KSP-S5-2]|uniref:acyl-CoA dehydrogenase C-terminal domain-containing protein n=1 Tax=Teredinibacter sp. KSP-S5-2 TaxID=3034506 RepID=UPI0029352E37|nr:acyl-CoA dehydrogenase C-terminal domain-containing protein [Teredinibacter sp. KSP-S5-2]WNO07681.1 acyl-CoA dehydrogenase C-terminal domain-containing protein [Teredinibacter sp. KSP-S5-2]